MTADLSSAMWLIGTGPMARDYAQVFAALGTRFTVIGRDNEKAQAFCKSISTHTGIATAMGGGVEQAVAAVRAGKLAAPRHAVVAVPVDRLAHVASVLAPHCGSILLEKPGALEVGELRALHDIPTVASGACQIHIAYNRRFFDSVQTLRARLAEDGPVLSASLEFDEPVPRIVALPTPAAIKARWGFANASHVFDLLFYLCGRPVAERSLGALPGDPLVPWHPSGSVFVGTGQTDRGTHYVYHGNFGSVGRWRLALSVPNKRYFLMPLETLQVAEGAVVSLRDVPLPAGAHPELKPGLLGQVRAFLAGDPNREMVTLSDQLWHMSHLANLFGYPK
jgi:predicted dehydrogenase